MRPDLSLLGTPTDKRERSMVKEPRFEAHGYRSLSRGSVNRSLSGIALRRDSMSAVLYIELTSEAHLSGTPLRVIGRDNMSSYPVIGVTSVDYNFRGSFESHVVGSYKKGQPDLNYCRSASLQ